MEKITLSQALAQLNRDEITADDINRLTDAEYRAFTESLGWPNHIAIVIRSRYKELLQGGGSSAQQRSLPSTSAATQQRQKNPQQPTAQKNPQQPTAAAQQQPTAQKNPQQPTAAAQQQPTAQKNPQQPTAQKNLQQPTAAARLQADAPVSVQLMKQICVEENRKDKTIYVPQVVARSQYTVLDKVDIPMIGNVELRRYVVELPQYSGDNDKECKTIMLMGESGAGKSTLINGLLNMYAGVQFCDDWRLELIPETKKSQSVSQTDHISIYHVNVRGGCSFQFIDTPGVNDTRGAEISFMQAFRTLFKYINKVDFIGFVIDASCNRLTETQIKIFNDVYTNFHRNVTDNIVFLVTHCDYQGEPSCIKIIKSSDVLCRKDQQGNPLYFAFNFACLNKSSKSDLSKVQWEESERNAIELLASCESQCEMTESLHVVEERLQLEEMIAKMKSDINEGVGEVLRLAELERVNQQTESHMDNVMCRLKVLRKQKEEIEESMTECQKRVAALKRELERDARTENPEGMTGFVSVVSLYAPSLAPMINTALSFMTRQQLEANTRRIERAIQYWEDRRQREAERLRELEEDIAETSANQTNSANHIQTLKAKHQKDVAKLDEKRNKVSLLIDKICNRRRELQQGAATNDEPISVALKAELENGNLSNQLRTREYENFISYAKNKENM